MKKILIFILCFSTLFLCFAIPSFADASTGYFSDGESFVFSDKLSGFPPSSEEYYFDFISNNSSFSSFRFSFNSLDLNSLEVFYDEVNVYSSGSWLDESFRTITFSGDYYIDSSLRSYFLLNESPSSTYDYAFGLLKDAIYGSGSITENQSFVITLIATVFSVLVVALPVIVIYILIKFFVGTIARY